MLIGRIYMNKKSNSYPILPLRDSVMFPGMVAPLLVGREKSIIALESAVKNNIKILMIAQKDASIDEPEINNLYSVGVIGNVLQLLKLPDGAVKLLVEAQTRVKVTEFLDNSSFFEANVKELKEVDLNEFESEMLIRSLINQFDQYVKLNKRVNQETLASLGDIKNPSQVIDLVAAHLMIRPNQKQEILELTNIKKRLKLVYEIIETEISVLNTEKKIKNRVKKQMEKTQKEYYLNEQLKAIKKELDEDDEIKGELDSLEKQIKATKFTKEAKDKANSELKKLKSMNSNSAESSIIRNYLEWLINMPWAKYSKGGTDIKSALSVLNEDHYGLEKVKERIIEYLAVQQRIKKIKGSILCLVGPPGVGKTSLAKSIADATNREFVRFSLGGVRDESEIRGHRRTYIGAMPGKIIQYMKKAKTANPVFLLDEIDKMGADFRGDPASALLEVLDPEQNSKFIDHYLEVEYDLSDVIFIATANSLNIPRPLLDRMEVIRLSGYTEEEKIQIAKGYLINKQKSNNGLTPSEWSITDEAISDLISYYTREAGVRNLERELSNLTRKALRQIIEQNLNKVEVNRQNLSKYAGVRKYSYHEVEVDDLIGITTGLAYTEVGGELLSIEAVSLPGRGQIKTTGKLGSVMQESAAAAFSYFRSKSLDFGITPPIYQKRDIHIHVPEGATPKDGPSAGIALFTSIVSIMSSIPVKKDVAMTGEITLRGRVLAIGGLKEKLLAALRGGIKTVIIPNENSKDLAELPTSIKQGLKIIAVSSAKEVLDIALIKPLKAIEWLDLEANLENDKAIINQVKH